MISLIMLIDRKVNAKLRAAVYAAGRLPNPALLYDVQSRHTGNGEVTRSLSLSSTRFANGVIAAEHNRAPISEIATAPPSV